MTLDAIKEAIAELPPDDRTELAEWIQSQNGAVTRDGVQRNGSALGWMKGTVEVVGDIVEPTGERWEADE